METPRVLAPAGPVNRLRVLESSRQLQNMKLIESSLNSLETTRSVVGFGLIKLKFDSIVASQP